MLRLAGTLPPKPRGRNSRDPIWLREEKKERRKGKKKEKQKRGKIIDAISAMRKEAAIYCCYFYCRGAQRRRWRGKNGTLNIVSLLAISLAKERISLATAARLGNGELEGHTRGLRGVERTHRIWPAHPFGRAPRVPVLHPVACPRARGTRLVFLPWMSQKRASGFTSVSLPFRRGIVASW